MIMQHHGQKVLVCVVVQHEIYYLDLVDVHMGWG